MLSPRPRVTELQVRSWFSDSLQYFTRTRLLDVLYCPNRVFNFDEINIHQVVNWVLSCCGVKSTKHANTDDQTEKGSVTALIMASASGNFPPPMLIMKGTGPDSLHFPVYNFNDPEK